MSELTVGGALLMVGASVLFMCGLDYTLDRVDAWLRRRRL